MTETSDPTMYFNGINGATGEYSFPAISAQKFSDAIVSGVSEGDPDQEALRFWYEQYVKSGHYGVKEGINQKNLNETGWGVVFAYDADPAIIDALKPLLEWRKSQAGQYYKEYSGGMGGVRPNDTKSGWLTRQGGSVGPADPENVPYYLLIVGSPEQISYRFQTLLDVQYAVGRIHFDSVEEYARYAESVVLAEQQQVRLPRRVSFFGVANPDDPATRLSSTQLVAPLLESLPNEKQAKGWDFQPVVGDEAKKARLARLIGGAETPGLLFTASHGMGFPKDDPRQLPHQGALLCQDWPGPRVFQGKIPEDFYFSASDLGADARLLGMVAFFFACYGAGTPLQDEFAQQTFKDKRVEIAPRPFIAGLPRRMLSHPAGGALAVVGHVERAWGHSFFWGKNRSLAAFQSAMLALMDGYPVGYALEYFNERYAEISTELTDLLGEVQFGLTVDPFELAGKWTGNNDAKNYIILGDPAVRLMVADSSTAQLPERPSLVVPASTPTGAGIPGAHLKQVEAFSTGEAPLGVSAAAAAVAPAEAAHPANPGATAFAQAAAVPQTPAAPGATGATAAAVSIPDLLNKLAAFLSQAVDSAATLDVRTYTSDDINKVTFEKGEPQGASLRALTLIKALGDVQQVVPVEDNRVDRELWQIHQESVQQAQQSRAELIKTVLSVAASLANTRLGRGE